MRIYVVGSLRNPKIPQIGNLLRKAGHQVFDDWFAGGERADDSWQEYEQLRGRTYWEALDAPNARHIFEYDLKWLDWAEAGVLVMPAGMSGHMEMTYLRGQGKPAVILVEPAQEFERWDVMRLFSTDRVFSEGQLVEVLKSYEDEHPGLRSVDHAPWNA